MLTKLKCFFGFHGWEYSDVDKPNYGIALKKRKCKCCGTNQEQFLVTQLVPEIPTNDCPKVAVWRTVIRPDKPWPRSESSVPDKPTPTPKRPSSKLPKINVDTPMPECKEPVVYDFCYVVQYKFLPKDPLTIKLFRKQENAQNFKQKCTSQKTLCSLIILDFED